MQESLRTISYEPITILFFHVSLQLHHLLTYISLCAPTMVNTNFSLFFILRECLARGPTLGMGSIRVFWPNQHIERCHSSHTLRQEGRDDLLVVVNLGPAHFYLLQLFCQASSKEEPIKGASKSWGPRANKGKTWGMEMLAEEREWGQEGEREKEKRKRRKGWKKNGEEMRRNKDGYTGGSNWKIVTKIASRYLLTTI